MHIYVKKRNKHKNQPNKQTKQTNPISWPHAAKVSANMLSDMLWYRAACIIAEAFQEDALH